MKKFKFKSRFWLIYCGVTVSLVLLISAGLMILYSYLSALESTQPIHRAQSVFDTYFSSGKFEDAMNLANFEVSEFETRKAAAETVRKMTEGKKLTFYSIPAGEGEAKYNVVIADESQKEIGENATDENLGPAVHGIPSTKIATIHFVLSQEESAWGFVGYDFEKLEFFLKPTEKITVTAPSDSTLTLNGIPVSKDYIVKEEDHVYNQFLKKDVPGIKLVTYEIADLHTTPEIACKDFNGLDQTLSREEGKSGYVAQLNFSTALQEKYGERMLAGMKEYAKYIQNDNSLTRVRPYFDTSSLFYRHIYENIGAFVTDHNGFSFRNEKVGEFYAFDENNFCCRVSFDHLLHRWGKEDYVDPLDMIIFVRKINNQYYIYDRLNAE